MPLKEALEAYLVEGVNWSRQQNGFMRFFGAAAYHGDEKVSQQVVQPIAEVMQGMVRDILEAAVKRGEIREDVDVEASARLINTLLIAAGDAQLFPSLNTYYCLLDENCSADRLMKSILELVQRGIGTGENGPSGQTAGENSL